MCGRYTLTADQEALSVALGVEGLVHPRPRWNVAPGQEAPVLLADPEGRAAPARRTWGLVPSWARDPAIGHRLVNARLETAHEKPSFREAMSLRRCLVPADGFYEWRAETGGKVPWWIHCDGEVLTLAGLWERWKGPGGERLTYTILTRPATAPLDRLHHRMPVVVSPGGREEWLAPGMSVELLRDRLLASSPPPFRTRRVSTRVNRPDHDDPECIRDVGDGDGPPPPPEQTRLFS